MTEREYAVEVFDSAPGAGLNIVPVGNRYQAFKRLEYYQKLNATRGTYGITAKVVYRYTFMPDMPWTETT